MKVQLVILLLTLLSVAFCVDVSRDVPSLKEIADRIWQAKIYRGVKTYNDALIVADALKMAFENSTLEDVPAVPFPCSPTGRSNPRPTNARQLLPGDVDIVIAVGDSLTAAFGADATNFFNLFTDYRATSFSGGFLRPIEEVSTVPGILKVFNPSVTGYSVASGDENSAGANLNVAVSGGDSYGLAYQVDLLVSKLQNYDRSGWKLLSLFIGGNDLCDACAEKEKFSTANFKANVMAALDTIKNQIPNVFISLILPPDVTILSELTSGLCAILRPFECTCSNDPYTSPLHKEYVTALHEIERDPRYADQANFFIAVQPFLELIKIPRLPDGSPDMTYFAPDCFHFSAKSHSAAGLSLWNNLLELPNEKKRDWFVGEPFECPVENQYLQ